MKTKTIIIIAIASIILLGAGTYLWQEAFKQGEISGQTKLSTSIFKEVGETGYLRVPTVDSEGKQAFAVLQLIKDEKGQVMLFTPQ